MKPFTNSIIVLALLFTAASVIACNYDKKVITVTKNEPVAANSSDTLIYHFLDASVPPQFHRSYTIRVTPGQVYLAISDYSQVLSADSLILAKAAYESFTTAINGLHIKKKDETTGRGCTGGHSEQFDLYPGTGKGVKGYTYFCGGGQYGNLDGDVVEAAKLFNALVPDLGSKIDATRK